MSKKGGTGKRGFQEVAHATLKGWTVANAANNNASFWPAIANAHAVFASSCAQLGLHSTFYTVDLIRVRKKVYTCH